MDLAPNTALAMRVTGRQRATPTLSTADRDRIAAPLHRQKARALRYCHRDGRNGMIVLRLSGEKCELTMPISVCDGAAVTKVLKLARGVTHSGYLWQAAWCNDLIARGRIPSGF